MPTVTVNHRKKLRFRPNLRGWMVIAAGAFLLSSLAADAVASADRIRSGVRAGGIELGGRTFDEADRLLTRRAKELVAAPALLSAEGNVLSVSSDQVDFFPDVDATLQQAEAVGRRGNILVRMWQRLRSYFAASGIGWSADIDRATAGQLVSDWAAKFESPGHEAGVRAEAGRILPVPPLPGRRLERDAAVRTLTRSLETWPRRPLPLPFVLKGHRTDVRDARAAADRGNLLIRSPITLSSPSGQIELQPAELSALLEAVPRRRHGGWALEVRFAPNLVRDQLGPRMKPFERAEKDATFDVSGPAVVVNPSQDGLTFDAARTARALTDVADNDPPRTTGVAFTARHPKLSTDEARNLHITEMVSTFTTHHPCCVPRVKNIHIIADQLDGTIVRPGDVFSLNRTAGQRTPEKGYVLAPMIYDGEFKDQIGGGVSQFATTLFNAVFFGGYQFVSYQAHSYYISRYPAGRDATVSWPAPDFKFRNDSPSGILIKTSYTGTSVTVTLYGSKEGRSVDAKAEDRTNLTDPPHKEQPDPTLPPGARELKQPGAQGFDIVVWRIIIKDGTTKRQKFFTRYLPEPEIVLVGPGTPPAPSPSPSPASGSPAPASPPPTPPVPARTP